MSLVRGAKAGLLVAVLLAAGCASGPQVSEAEARQEYERGAAMVAKETEYRVRHILVATREQADAALARIRAGETFAKVAMDVSQDPGSRDKGGDLDWSLPQYFVEPFSRAMVGLAPQGLTAAPVRSEFGWHLIEVLGTRPATVPPYEQVRERIIKRLQERKAAEAKKAG